MLRVDRGDLVLQRFDFAHHHDRLQLVFVLRFLGIEFFAALLESLNLDGNLATTILEPLHLCLH
ncbi:MAG: hypothetical protein EBR63_03670, partial [Actinobacteria bacterium]|nr:hypothetical protein [Actinomycetota bacterium]